MRSPAPPRLPPLTPLTLLLLLALTPVVLSQSADDLPDNSSAAALLSLPSSFHSALSVLVRVCSSFSLLFSAFVVVAFFLLPRLRHEYNARFVLLLACSDLLHAALLLLGPLQRDSTSLLFADSATPSGWCSAHSSLLLYATLVSLSWTSVIAINHFLVVYYAASILQVRRYQLAQHLTAWLLPLLPVLLLLRLPHSDAALASPLCWVGMADARLAYPSSAWLLLLPQLVGCILLSSCYILALRYGRRLTTQVVTVPASGTQTPAPKDVSQIGAGGASTVVQKVSGGVVAAQISRAVLSDKYEKMKRKVSLYLLCTFLLTFPLLLASISLLSSASLPSAYLSFLFLLQAAVSASSGVLHSCAYGWNLRLFYHLYPPASQPALLTACLTALRLPPPPPAQSPAASPPFAYNSRIHPSALGHPVASPYLSSRIVSTVGRPSWRASTVQMAQLQGYSNRMAVRRVDGGTNALNGSGSEDDSSGSAGSLQGTPVLSQGVLLSPPAMESAGITLSPIMMDGGSESASPRVSHTAHPSFGHISFARRYSATQSATTMLALPTDGGSISIAHHPNVASSSPTLSALGEPLPLHLQPNTTFSSASNPQSALPWLPSLSLPPHHPSGLPPSAAPGLAPVRALRTHSSFSSSSRASVSFISPTHQSSLTPRGEGGDATEGASGAGMRVLVSGWEGAGGMTARRNSHEEAKELETLDEEDEKDSDDSHTPTETAAAPRASIDSSSNIDPSPLLSPTSVSSPTAACPEQSRGTVILSPLPAYSPSAGAHSRSLSPSTSHSGTPSSQHTAGSRYSFSLPSFGRTSLSTPTSSRSSPHMATRVAAAGYSPRPAGALDRRPLRVNPAPPASNSATASPKATTGRLVAAAAAPPGTGAEAVVAGSVRPRAWASRQSLPSEVAAMPAELRTGVLRSHRLSMRRSSEPFITQ